MEYEQLNHVLDQVRPSRQQEEAMLKRLLGEERMEHKMKRGRNLPKLAAAALVAVLAVTSALAVVTGLDRRLLNYFGAEPGQEELFSPGAVVVDKTLTDQGTTLHIGQVVADRYSALVLLDLTAPAGTVLDGDYYVLGDSIRATAPDGTKMSGWGTGWTLLEDEDPGDNHISLLMRVNTMYEDFNFLGAKLSLDFEGLYDNNLEKNALAQGRWKCTVTLPGGDPGRYAAMEEPVEVGGNQVTLKSLYVSPLSLTWELGEGEDDLESIDTSATFDREDWPETVFVTTKGGAVVPVEEPHFLLTQYKTDLLEEDRGCYSFRLAEITDPAEVTAVTIFGQTFPLEG